MDLKVIQENFRSLETRTEELVKMIEGLKAETTAQIEELNSKIEELKEMRRGPGRPPKVQSDGIDSE